jgi:5-methylcytosine-specific restriction protein A
MNSFLITFKPATENPERGWPLEELQRLVRRTDKGLAVGEPWRFHARKQAKLRDRVFLLLQGKAGPAIIGYGRVAGAPEHTDGHWRVPVEFESLVDPTLSVLAEKEELVSIDDGHRLWRTQSSGVLIPRDVAVALEALVVGRPPRARADMDESNPDWTRDELILALNLYLQHREHPPGKNSEEIRDLSRKLHRLGEVLFPREVRAATFRNENGVYMKLMNFRRLDPQFFAASGGTGLSRGAKADEDVWAEFANDEARCRRTADAIVASLDSPDECMAWQDTQSGEDFEEAEEGRLLTRRHLSRERNRKLVEKKRKQAMRKHGRLACEACGFDFASRYGVRGQGFMECHHLKPIATLGEGEKTRLADLALLCSNCHRIIHRSKPWLSVGDLKRLMVAAR